jgi:hypothetical protein
VRQNPVYQHRVSRERDMPLPFLSEMGLLACSGASPRAALWTFSRILRETRRQGRCVDQRERHGDGRAALERSRHEVLRHADRWPCTEDRHPEQDRRCDCAGSDEDTTTWWNSHFQSSPRETNGCSRSTQI